MKKILILILKTTFIILTLFMTICFEYIIFNVLIYYLFNTKEMEELVGSRYIQYR